MSFLDFDRTQLRAIFAEFVGTAVFLLGSTLTVTKSGGDLMAIASAFGLTLIVAIAMTAAVSGGHINPAVTLSMILTRNIPPLVALGYIIAQLAGGVLGTAIGRLILPSLKGALELAPNVSPGGGFLAEAAGTFILVSTVFSMAVQPSAGVQTSDKVAFRSHAPLVIGMSVWAMHLALVGVDGCGINPARWFGTAAVLNGFSSHSWIYILGPMVGAVVAAAAQLLMFGRVRPDDEEVAAGAPSPKPHSP